ncbi:MAG: tyrosine-type recombinase/integrase [Thermoleophilia bacterium]|nr:tyrosine-type recombinase/integrase [Thermoleophilia bacterium]
MDGNWVITALAHEASRGQPEAHRSTASGAPGHATNHYRWFKKAAKSAGVEWAAFHTLRHTAGSRWLHSGYNHAVVSRLLGHSDAAFTMRVYVHVRNDDLPDGDDIAAAVGQ